MFEPALKCQHNTIFRQNQSLKLFITFKMAYSCCFSLGENLDFADFLQKQFNSIDCWTGSIFVPGLKPGSSFFGIMHRSATKPPMQTSSMKKQGRFMDSCKLRIRQRLNQGFERHPKAQNCPKLVRLEQCEDHQLFKFNLLLIFLTFFKQIGQSRPLFLFIFVFS